MCIRDSAEGMHHTHCNEVTSPLRFFDYHASETIEKRVIKMDGSVKQPFRHVDEPLFRGIYSLNERIDPHPSHEVRDGGGIRLSLACLGFQAKQRSSVIGFRTNGNVSAGNHSRVIRGQNEV